MRYAKYISLLRESNVNRDVCNAHLGYGISAQINDMINSSRKVLADCIAPYQNRAKSNCIYTNQITPNRYKSLGFTTSIIKRLPQMRVRVALTYFRFDNIFFTKFSAFGVSWHVYPGTVRKESNKIRK